MGLKVAIPCGQSGAVTHTGATLAVTRRDGGSLVVSGREGFLVVGLALGLPVVVPRGLSVTLRRGGETLVIRNPWATPGVLFTGPESFAVVGPGLAKRLAAKGVA
jgi:hypothetical protein